MNALKDLEGNPNKLRCDIHTVSLLFCFERRVSNPSLCVDRPTPCQFSTAGSIPTPNSNFPAKLNFTCFPSSVSTDVFQNLSLGRPLPGIAVLKTCPSNGRKDYKGRNQSLGIASGWSGDRLMGGKMVVDPSR